MKKIDSVCAEICRVAGRKPALEGFFVMVGTSS